MKVSFLKNQINELENKKKNILIENKIKIELLDEEIFLVNEKIKKSQEIKKTCNTSAFIVNNNEFYLFNLDKKSSLLNERKKVQESFSQSLFLIDYEIKKFQCLFEKLIKEKKNEELKKEQKEIDDFSVISFFYKNEKK